jgi:hypothetical protein
MTVPIEDSSGRGALSLLIDLDSAEGTPPSGTVNRPPEKWIYVCANG